MDELKFKQNSDEGYVSIHRQWGESVQQYIGFCEANKGGVWEFWAARVFISSKQLREIADFIERQAQHPKG